MSDRGEAECANLISSTAVSGELHAINPHKTIAPAARRRNAGETQFGRANRSVMIDIKMGRLGLRREGWRPSTTALSDLSPEE